MQIAAQEDAIDDLRLKTDRDYVKQISLLALKDIQKLKNARTILYGTQEGSLGTLIEIPERAYKFMELMVQVMEKEGITNFGKMSRKDYRTVKIDSLKKECFNIIDGNFLEYFLDIEGKQQLSITHHLLHIKDSHTSHSHLKDIRTLIEAMRDKH